MYFVTKQRPASWEMDRDRGLEQYLGCCEKVY